MNAARVKDQIRNLNQIDKIEVYRWIDEEAANRIRQDLTRRMGSEIPLTDRLHPCVPIFC